MSKQIFFYIMVMALVTYFIRILPLILLRSQITNKYVKSFLYYIPYVTLSIMIFPAILFATSSRSSAVVGFILAILVAYKFENLFLVTIVACTSVIVVGLFL